MSPSSVVRVVALVLLVSGCTSPPEALPDAGVAGDAGGPPTEGIQDGGEAAHAAPVEASRATGAELLMAVPSSDSPAFGGHVTVTEIEAPGAMPVQEGDGILRFEAFGPAPGTAPEVFAEWTELVRQRFLQEPSSEQRAELDARLEEVPVIDATPVFINALLGLDMADPQDIVRAGAITQWWYLKQIRYKQVILDSNPEALLPIQIRNRMLVVDGWIRMWKRTLEAEGGVDRLRARVAQLEADRKKAREQQQREYEEKLRRRAEEQAETDAPR